MRQRVFVDGVVLDVDAEPGTSFSVIRDGDSRSIRIAASGEPFWLYSTEPDNLVSPGHAVTLINGVRGIQPIAEASVPNVPMAHISEIGEWPVIEDPNGQIALLDRSAMLAVQQRMDEAMPTMGDTLAREMLAGVPAPGVPFELIGTAETRVASSPTFEFGFSGFRPAEPAGAIFGSNVVHSPWYQPFPSDIQSFIGSGGDPAGRWSDYVFINGVRMAATTWIPAGYTPENPPGGWWAGRGRAKIEPNVVQSRPRMELAPSGLAGKRKMRLDD